MNETEVSDPGALAPPGKDDRRIMHALAGLPRGESRDVTWNVTQEDIDAGERMDCWRCPVALSLEREFPGLFAEADGATLTLYDKDEDGGIGLRVAQARTPSHVQEFMEDFDGEDSVVPMTITATFTIL